MSSRDWTPEDQKQIEAMPGYPWLPCPICNGHEGCVHPYPQRARAFNPGIVWPTSIEEGK